MFEVRIRGSIEGGRGAEFIHIFILDQQPIITHIMFYNYIFSVLVIHVTVLMLNTLVNIDEVILKSEDSTRSF